MLEKLDDAVFSNDIIFVNTDPDNDTFFGNDIGLNNANLIEPMLTLMMLILMKMILKLLFMLDLWLGVIDISNAWYIKTR